LHVPRDDPQHDIEANNTAGDGEAALKAGSPNATVTKMPIKTAAAVNPNIQRIVRIRDARYRLPPPFAGVLNP
jgi:hypothetical protein